MHQETLTLWRLAHTPIGSVVDRTTTDVKIVMTALAMIVLVTATERTVAPTVVTAATAQDPLPVATTMTIVDPGLRLLDGRMTEGLQGTIMTVTSDGEVIMTGHLIMMTAAVMIMNVAGMTEGLAKTGLVKTDPAKTGRVKRGRPAKTDRPAKTRPPTRRDLLGATEMEDGRAKWRVVRGVACLT